MFELDTYQDFFRRLISLEKEEEMKRHEREMNQLTAKEREEKGRCLTGVTPVSTDSGVGGEQHLTFARPDREPLPDHEITIGDLVQISRNRPLDDNNPTATVWNRSSRTLTLSLSNTLPGWTRNGQLRIDLYVDNVTYDRMLDALFVLKGLPHERERLRDVLLEKQIPRESELSRSIQYTNGNLNPSQKEAVRRALAAEDVFLVHGPPGTGKTVTITEIIGQAVKAEDRVLATAASNTAVDNIVSNLIGQSVDVVRIGHPARTLPALREHTLDARLEDNPTYQRSVAKREEALDLIDERRDLTTPSGQWRRGMSNEQIRQLAEEGRGNRGVSAQKIQEMADYIEMSNRIDELFDESDRLEQRAIDRVLESADVICSTNSTAGSDVLSGEEFDLVAIDEATQATEPSCLIPVTRGRKLVMAGDHRQLPPTVLNEEARDAGLSQSLFERLMNWQGANISKRLQIQYRMHEDIMGFSNQQFYDGSLVASEEVRTHTLDGIPQYHPEGLDSPFRDVLRSRPPVIWIDPDCEEGEQRHPGSTSVHNPATMSTTVDLANDMLRAGLEADSLGVITPYADQKRLIRERLDSEDLEVDTVDGFQGREKEAVLIDFVRSNPDGEVGFLHDVRRLNVSLTRARRKLIIIGDRETLSHHRLYRKLAEYVEQVGRYLQAETSVNEGT